jgi:raffinose/stachyose/melibiose transport system permease protein
MQYSAPVRRLRLPRLRTSQWLLLAGLAALAFLWLVPFLFVVMTALRPQGDLLSRGAFSLPSAIRWSNFARAWEIGHFDIYFRNSGLLILFKVPLGILLASLAAYPLAKMNFRLNAPIFLFFLLGLAIPIHVTLLPLVIMVKQMGIANTLWALIPPYVVFGLPLQILVMRGFFRTIPTELIEAARIDGASELRIFGQLMLPLSVPALATLFIIDALATWNELLIALVLISAEEWRTVPVGLLHFQGEFSSQYTQMMAGVVIAMLPILVLYVVFQRYLVSGITAGALKE